MEEKKDEFMRIGGDSDFQDRSNSIFGSLDKLEPAQKSETDSEVKRPRAPKHIPDHVLHPDKWTKYSLEDDGTDRNTGLSGDALNRHVAFSFIGEIRKRKQNPSTDACAESDVVMSEKHVFSKSAIKHDKEVGEVHPKSQIVEGVNVMPEYVIGVSPAKTPKREPKTRTDDKKLHSPGDTVCLDHLEENETADSTMKGSENVSGSMGGQQDGAEFVKRKVKSRRLRAHKSSTEDE